MTAEDEKNRDNHQWQEKEHGSRAWPILLFGVGATAASFAVRQLRRTADWFYTQVRQLRRTADWFYTQLNRSKSYSSWRSATSNSSHRSYKDEAWNKFNRRMQEHEEEMERVERIKRMQSVFNRARNKYTKGYESWRDDGPGAYHHVPRDDWYWKTDTSYKEQRTNSKSTPRESGSYAMSHHYSVLDLDRSRAKPYSDVEIKTAFRAKAMQYHPDQNQENKDAAEAKFKEVMMSYEAIKLERKNG